LTLSEHKISGPDRATVYSHARLHDLPGGPSGASNKDLAQLRQLAVWEGESCHI